MGIFDMYSDVMQTVGDALKKVDPFGPIGEAGEMVSGLFGAGELISENSTDPLWSVVGNTAEAASVALISLPSAKQTEIIAAGLNAVLGMQNLCGWTNEPSQGNGYSESAVRFSDISESLDAAMPDDR